jgi:hypothetical protein
MQGTMTWRVALKELILLELMRHQYELHQRYMSMWFNYEDDERAHLYRSVRSERRRSVPFIRVRHVPNRSRVISHATVVF